MVFVFFLTTGQTNEQDNFRDNHHFFGASHGYLVAALFPFSLFLLALLWFYQICFLSVPSVHFVLYSVRFSFILLFFVRCSFYSWRYENRRKVNRSSCVTLFPLFFLWGAPIAQQTRHERMRNRPLLPLPPFCQFFLWDFFFDFLQCKIDSLGCSSQCTRSAIFWARTPDFVAKICTY